MEQKIVQSVFGETKNGQQVYLFHIPNNTNDYIEVSNYGCTIKSIHIHDRQGEMRNVLRGYETLAEYEQAATGLGAVCDGLSSQLSGALAHKIWNVEETGGNYVFLSCQVDEEESGLGTALTFGAKIMWVNLNRIVIDLFAAAENGAVMAPGCNLVFQLPGGDGYTLRTFCPQAAVGEQMVPVENTAYAEMNFVPLTEEPQIFVSPQEEMKPMAELANRAAGLTISAYGNMDSLICAALPDHGVQMNQFMLHGVELKRGESFSGRMIYGFDRLYTEEELENPEPSPFSAFFG